MEAIEQKIREAFKRKELIRLLWEAGGSCASVTILLLTDSNPRVFIAAMVYWEFEFIKFLMERLRCDQGTIPVAEPAPGHERDKIVE